MQTYRGDDHTTVTAWTPSSSARVRLAVWADAAPANWMGPGLLQPQLTPITQADSFVTSSIGLSYTMHAHDGAGQIPSKALGTSQPLGRAQHFSIIRADRLPSRDLFEVSSGGNRHSKRGRRACRRPWPPRWHAWHAAPRRRGRPGPPVPCE